MPIHTSTTVVPIQQNDKAIEPRPEFNTYSAKVTVEQYSKITVALREHQFCAPIRVEQQRVITRSERPQATARTAVELSAVLLGTTAMLLGARDARRPEPSPVSLAAVRYGGGVALAGLIALFVDGARTFDKTSVQERFVRVPVPAQECDRVPADGQRVVLQFQDTHWLEGVTGAHGKIIFPLDAAAQATLREHKGRFSVWHQGKLLGEFGASPPPARD